jgi:hypothetical protein
MPTTLDARGGEVLRTLPDSGGGDPYGTPGATRDDGVDNVKILPGWDGYVPVEEPWTHARAGELLAKTDTTASFELSSDQGTIDLDVRIEGAKVTLSTRAITARAGDPAAWNKLSLAFALRDDEHFFGLGERYGSVDHRGLSMYSWCEEGGLGGGEGKPRDEVTPYPNGASMTYFPVPFFMSSAGYARQGGAHHARRRHRARRPTRERARDGRQRLRRSPARSAPDVRRQGRDRGVLRDEPRRRGRPAAYHDAARARDRRGAGRRDVVGEGAARAPHPLGRLANALSSTRRAHGVVKTATSSNVSRMESSTQYGPI